MNLIESRLYDRESIKEIHRYLVRAKQQYSTFACQMACQVTLSKAPSWTGLSKLPRDGTQVSYTYYKRNQHPFGKPKRRHQCFKSCWNTTILIQHLNCSTILTRCCTFISKLNVSEYQAFSIYFFILKTDNLIKSSTCLLNAFHTEYIYPANFLPSSN